MQEENKMLPNIKEINEIKEYVLETKVAKLLQTYQQKRDKILEAIDKQFCEEYEAVDIEKRCDITPSNSALNIQQSKHNILKNKKHPFDDL